MKTALWVLLIAALLALVFYFLPSVDFAGAETVVAGAADGRVSAPDSNRRGGAKRRITSPSPSQLLLSQSFRDIVRESEGGQMPSQEEFSRRRHSTDDTQRKTGPSSPEGRPADQLSGSAPAVESSPTMKEGERHSPDERSEHWPDSTPPGGSNGGAAGRILRPPTVYVFMGWSERGIFLGGRLFDMAKDCQTKRDEDRERHPLVLFSACTEIPAVRQTL